MRLLLLLLILSFSAQAKVYRWVDEQGQVHYSDKPEHPLAIEVDINTEPLQVKFAKPQHQLSPEPEAIVIAQAQIISPADQQTIRNNQGDFNILVQVEPQLLPSQQLQLIMDGQPLGLPQRNPNFELSNINRGSHQFSVNIINQQQQVLSSSATITVFLHRAHLNNPMHRPGKKPQPRN